MPRLIKTWCDLSRLIKKCYNSNIHYNLQFSIKNLFNFSLRLIQNSLIPTNLLQFSACESLPSEDEDHTHADNLVTLPFHRPSVSNPPFYYDDSLRSLAMFEDENDAYILTDDLNGAIDRTRTPSADTNTEICKTPSPQPSVRNQRNVVEDKVRNGFEEKLLKTIRKLRMILKLVGIIIFGA